MKLSTRSRYGTRIVLELARHYGGGPLQVSAIAEVQKIPIKYLEQLIRTLKQAKLIKSVRGSKGGHLLNRKPELITVLTISFKKDKFSELDISCEKGAENKAITIQISQKKITRIIESQIILNTMNCPCKKKILESSVTISFCQKRTSRSIFHGIECDENVHSLSGLANSPINQKLVPKAATLTGALADQILLL